VGWGYPFQPTTAVRTKPSYRFKPQNVISSVYRRTISYHEYRGRKYLYIIYIRVEIHGNETTTASPHPLTCADYIIIRRRVKWRRRRFNYYVLRWRLPVARCRDGYTTTAGGDPSQYIILLYYRDAKPLNSERKNSFAKRDTCHFAAAV